MCFSEASKKPHFSLSIRLKIQPREHGIDERGNFLDWTRPQFLAWAIAEFDTSNALCDNIPSLATTSTQSHPLPNERSRDDQPATKPCRHHRLLPPAVIRTRAGVSSAPDHSALNNHIHNRCFSCEIIRSLVTKNNHPIRSQCQH